MHVALFFATSRGNDDEGDFEVGTLVGKGSVRGQWFLKFKDDSTHTFSSRKKDYNKQWMFVQADGGGSPTVPPPPGAASAAPTTVPPPPEAPSAAQPTAEAPSAAQPTVPPSPEAPSAAPPTVPALPAGYESRLFDTDSLVLGAYHY